MAHFFYPSHTDTAHGIMAADQAAISELQLDQGQAYTRLGLWGGASDGSKLAIKVYRGGRVVSEGVAPLVKIKPQSYDNASHIQVVVISGLKGGDSISAIDANDAPQTNALPVSVYGSGPSDVIKRWSRAVNTDEFFTPPPGLCPLAIPYQAAASSKKYAMPELKVSCIGGPMVNVHGLAVHTTAGNDSSTAFTTAAWRCVPTWNGKNVSAHFAISGDGALVQFIPTTHIANAQGSPANYHWISVEVDNDGKNGMNFRQLTTLRYLFQWVCARYGIASQVATGCLFAKHSVFDEVTEDVCSETTTDGYEAIMSRRLSCHWWLEPIKGPNSHACPGKGIIAQLSDVI